MYNRGGRESDEDDVEDDEYELKECRGRNKEKEGQEKGDEVKVK